MFQFSSKGRRRQISQLKAVRQEEFLLAEGQSFFKSSVNWMRVIDIRKGNLLYSVYRFEY